MFPRMSRIKYWIVFAMALCSFYAIPLNIANELIRKTATISALVFFLHASVCRCHDFDSSGLTIFWFIVPIANLVLLVILLTKSGTPGPNIYDSCSINTISAQSYPPNLEQPNPTIKTSYNKEQLREALKANHPYQDMLLRNKM